MFYASIKIVLLAITTSITSLMFMTNYEKINNVFHLTPVKEQISMSNSKPIPVIASVDNVLEADIEKLLKEKKKQIKKEKLTAASHKKAIFQRIENKRAKILAKKRNNKTTTNKTNKTTIKNKTINSYSANQNMNDQIAKTMTVKDLIPEGAFSDSEIVEAENAVELMMGMSMDINVSKTDLDICFAEHNQSKCRELITQVLSDNFVK